MFYFMNLLYSWLWDIATMQNRFRELDIFSFSLSEDLIPITDSGTGDHLI